SASQTRAPSPRAIAGGQSKSANPTCPVDSRRTCSRSSSLLFGPYPDRSTRSSSCSWLTRRRARCPADTRSNARSSTFVLPLLHANATVVSRGRPVPGRRPQQPLARGELITLDALPGVELKQRTLQDPVRVGAARIDAESPADLHRAP